MPAGRPSLFTPALGAAILETFRTGIYAGPAAQRHNIHPRTLKRWLTKGQQNDASPELRAFSDAFAALDAQIEAETIGDIRAAASTQVVEIVREKKSKNTDGEEVVEVITERQKRAGDWRAQAWFAERRWPKRWAPPREGQSPALDDVPMPEIQAAADSREDDLDELFTDIPPELEAALRRNADRIRALLDKPDGN